MTTEIYRYQFAPEVCMEEVEASLVLAILATESLHGESQVRLDTAHYLATDRRSCVVDANTQVGRDCNNLFVGFLRREFGDDAFQVERVNKQEEHNLQEVSA